jgi:hypothetical protein
VPGQTTLRTLQPTDISTHDQTSSEWISQWVGLSGDNDPFVLRHCNFGQSNYYKNDDWACLRVSSDGALPAHFTLIPENHLDARPAHYHPVSLLEAAYPLHHELLTAYFDAIHTSYPLLDPTRFTKGNKIDLPLLGAMYALAKPFCPAALELPFGPIHSFVFQALPVETRTPRLETIEAALLFLQRHTQIHRAPTMPGLYAEIGSLVGTAHDAGLNIDPSNWDLSPSDRSRRKRLWWAVYISDKWAALGLGRPSYLNEENCNVPLLRDDDMPSSTIGGDLLAHTSVKMFVAMARLSQILSAVLTTFYTLKAAEQISRATTADVANVKTYFEQQLKEFHARHLIPLADVTDVFLDHTGVSLPFSSQALSNMTRNDLLSILHGRDRAFPRTATLHKANRTALHSNPLTGKTDHNLHFKASREPPSHTAASVLVVT